MTRQLDGAPDLSIVMPCYNEAENVPHTVPRLVKAFTQAGCVFEVVVVDNGSKDATWERLGALVEQFPGIVRRVKVEQNSLIAQ